MQLAVQGALILTVVSSLQTANRLGELGFQVGTVFAQPKLSLGHVNNQESAEGKESKQMLCYCYLHSKENDDSQGQKVSMLDY